MNLRTVLLLLISTFLLTGFTLSQDNPQTNPKIEELLTKLANTDESQDKVLILKDLCWFYRRVDAEKALDYGNRGEKLAEKINFPEGKAKCLNNIGILYSDKGDYQKALEYYHKSLEIKEKIGDQKGMMSSYNNIGHIYSLLGDYPKALEYCFKCLQKGKELNNKICIALSYNNIGDIYSLQGNYQKALESLEKGLKIREDLGDKRNLFRSYVNIGGIYSNLGNYNRALEYYQKSLKMSEELKDESGIADAWQRIGIIHYNQGDYKKASEYYFESLNIYKKIGDQQNIASTWNNMAVVYFDQGNYKQALDYANKSLEIYVKSGNKKGMANAYNTIAITYNTQGNYQEASEYLEKSFEIDRELKDKKGMARTLNNMGNAYYYQGNYISAAEYYFKSLKLKEELKDKTGIVKTHENIGDMYLYQEDYQEAEKHFKEALRISKTLGGEQNIAWAYHKIGKLHFDKKEYEQALENYSRSLRIMEELGVKYGIAESYFGIGSIYLNQRKYSQALDYFFKSLTIYEEIGNIKGIANSCQAAGKCYSIIGENQKAVQYLDKAWEIAKTIDSPEVARDAAEVLSVIHYKQKQYKKAYLYHVQFKNINDSLRNDQNVKKLTQLAMQYEFDKKQEQQRLEQENKDLKIKEEMNRQRLLRQTFFIAFILASFLALAIFRSFRIKQKANLLLAKQQKEIKAQRDQLHELNITKDKFFSIIGHDLKRPFSALIGLTKVLVAEFENFPKDQIKELLESVYKSSEITYNLLENLLEWARSQTGKIQWTPEKVELNQVAKSTIELLSRNAHQKNIRLQNEINGEKACVFADKNMLYTVFRNLISNAIKFTPDGGEVTIRSIEANNFIETRVNDTGIGIAEKDIEKLFRIDTHFSRSGTKDEQGTGLGLILCKEFLIKNGGNIRVESQVGKGSSFIFTLPVVGPPPEQ
jgi:signal transduction histidine kinase/uncharacterized protein HemY